MDGGDDLSVSAISAQKLEQITQTAQVLLTKKQIDQQGQVAKGLIESATQNALPPGVGTKINRVA